MKDVAGWIGWLLCEIAFKADMKGGTWALYRLGCWFYFIEIRVKFPDPKMGS